MEEQWRKNGGNVIHCEGKSKHRGTETRRGYFLSFLKIQRISKLRGSVVLYSHGDYVEGGLTYSKDPTTMRGTKNPAGRGPCGTRRGYRA